MILTIVSMQKVDIMIRASILPRIYIFAASDSSIHDVVVKCCLANNYKEDSILIEQWKKQLEVKNGKYVPLLHCVLWIVLQLLVLLLMTNMDCMRTWEVITGIY